METMMTSQPLSGPAFFFYTPEATAEGRQQGRFIPQMSMLPVVPPLPSTPVYSRPGSSCSQPPLLPKAPANTSNPSAPMTVLPSVLTPVASPMPIAIKPAIVLDTELGEIESLYSPATPPLSSSASSSSGSTISSPSSCAEALQTPLNPMFSGLDGKDLCDLDGELEPFPSIDWSGCASPPLTPVFLPCNIQAINTKTTTAPLSSQSIDRLSPPSTCPSLSPSPSPYARSVSSDDFCDPRNLTVGTVNSTLAPEFSALPTLCAGEDEDQKFVLRGATPCISPDSSAFDFQSQLCDGLSFDGLSDLDSEDDFVNGLVNLGGDDAESSLLTPAASFSDDSDAAQRAKRQKKSGPSPSMSAAVEPAAGSQAGSAQSQSPTSQQDAASSSSGSSAATEAKTNGSESATSGSENAGPSSAALPAPTSRRGRKQSLTEDPSKTFVCDLCNRRFRRQEHLKRHYRSLHTQEKPFECNECGKKFSRSDNLAQHARTHGSGAIVMNLVDDPDAVAAAHAAAGGYGYGHHHPLGMMGVPAGGDEYQTLGKVLFHVAAEIPGSSSSELSSGEDSDHGKKKRKRAD
ncbi:hypothetical protein VTJ83DRAFT_1974 [Remersonia thermophila]|uniref:C2H2-type domain-containing protein n=1 Tax=Remersonia thermophila TaxID=72144 RepID=A0ABR4DI06_9PEZI